MMLSLFTIARAYFVHMRLYRNLCVLSKCFKYNVYCFEVRIPFTLYWCRHRDHEAVQGHDQLRIRGQDHI